VCAGDSGGGILVKVSNVYYLRGIVSSSLLTNDYECDVDSYSVFTNVLKFTNWIKSKIYSG
jgi:secreted trypsin-like serine protease